MKKYFGLFICLFALNACDDGDMTFESFNFSEVAAASCANNNLVFKINGNEALILQIDNPADAFPFRNETGTRTLSLGGSNRVIYRTFSDAVSPSYFCSTIPPAAPTVTSELSTAGNANGTVVITTTLVSGTTALADAGYQHTIVFNNITFVNSEGGSITYETLNFGTYRTNPNITFTFNSLTPQSCGNGKFFKVFDANISNDPAKQNLNEVLEISIPVSQFPTNADQTVRVFLNESQGITANYRVYNGDVSAAAYCSQSAALPLLYEHWKASDGIDEIADPDDLGYFIITSSAGQNGSGNPTLIYTITLNKVKYTRLAPAAASGTAAGTFVRAVDNFGSVNF
ncbi:MAG TPA: hypothetical protein VFR70_05350 [Flavobacterium sp.]|nr:hypothetical protein [Flavobacterium sp.]